MLRINMYLFINNRQVDKLHEKKTRNESYDDNYLLVLQK